MWWCTYIKILFSLKKKDNSNTCFTNDDPWGHHTNLKYCMISISYYESIKFSDKVKWTIAAPRPGEGGNKE
jgi:hypothetical protein